MAKLNLFSQEWFESRGYTKNNDNSWSPPTINSNYIREKKGLPVKTETKLIVKQPIIKTPDFVLNSPLESFLTIPGIVAGLNGSKGLMRGHWSNTKKQKDLYCQIIKDELTAGKLRRHEGKVKVTYIGYKSALMDWDNFCASFKHIGDSLVKQKIIKEDNPKIVVEFIPKQMKCKRIDQKVIVIIQDI